MPTRAPTPTATPEPADLLAGITISPADALVPPQDDNAFTLDLLQQMESAHTNANFVDSAYSLATALAMLELGAKGQTETEIAAVLHNAGVTPEMQAAAWKQFDATLLATANGDHISLDVANALWLQQGLPFDTSFLNTLVNNFAAPSSQVDFTGDPQGAATKINKWVSDATHGMIPTVVSASDVEPLKLVLADAIYFDANWLDPFILNDTSAGTFHRSDNSRVTTQFMHTELVTLPTYSGGGVTALEKPYVGGHYVADIIMPTSQSISSFVAGLTPATLGGIEQKLVSTAYVQLTLPKFNISSQESLIPMLQALGMTSAFSDTLADFSGIDHLKDLHVGMAMQRAVMKTDEVGTTAAAATLIGGMGGAGPPPNITVVTFDHPFLFLIRDRTSGAIIFSAQVADPTAG
ncbi:MAG: serpin family protein [Candidatus Dormibacteraeota bacterium]|nr:serpin family protein [Candidatus Dormibacteraeota bacterium]